MCDCIKEVEKKVSGQVPLKHPAGSEISDVELEQKALVFIGNKSSVKLFTEIGYQLSFPTKAGMSRERHQKIKMFFNFCPFCGEKYPSNEEESSDTQEEG